MKIHHVTDEWDYTLGVEEIDRYYHLVLSILRQPDQTPPCEINGIRVRSRANVGMFRRTTWGAVAEVGLRGDMSNHGVAASSMLRFTTRRAANEQLIRVYNTLRHYERDLLR